MGFTILELLVVISIIGLLSSMLMATTRVTRVKARDARRAADMRQILLAIELYYDQNGCLPTTYSTTCAGAGGYSQSDAGSWDYSSQGGGFIDFLVSSGYLSKSPVDPVNNMTGDASPSGTFAYRYFCYTPTHVLPGLALGYFKESGGWAYVNASGGSGPNRSYFCQ